MLPARVAGLLVIGGLAVGCASNHRNGPPEAAAQVEPNAQVSSGQLEQSWQAANPGSRVGQVNAVLPARRMISVADLPRGEVKRGDVVTILVNPSGTRTVEAAVVAKNDGYIQLTYQQLQAGQRDPAIGDLAVWYPGGVAVPTGSLRPGTAGMTTMNPSTGTPPPPAVQMENTTPPNPPPANPPAGNTSSANPPPSNQPAEPPAANTGLPAENTAPPTTQPTGGVRSGTPPTTQPAELNK